MKQYLAVMLNNEPDENVTFEAPDFQQASKILKQMIKEGTMFTQVKLIELNSLYSRKYMF